ncbi:MAG TPA: glucosamine-6-phosphate deaminase [Stellaceae bacterium]
MGFRIEILPDAASLTARAADDVADRLRSLLSRQAKALVMFATGASQFGVLDRLIRAPGIDWTRIDMCHLDEYVGLAPDHPASFVRYLTERLTSRVPFASCLMIDGLAPDPAAECARLKAALASRTVDLALAGIGENGHLAFNDPPADFATTEPYIVVDLDAACRQQQVGEGWFPNLESVPARAISASIDFILSARRIVAAAPDARKARAVRDCLDEDAPITPRHPASALRRHGDAVVYLDPASAALLPVRPSR